jgi:hypothetical protein
MTVSNVREQFLEFYGEKDIDLFDTCFAKSRYAFHEVKEILEKTFPELDFIGEMLYGVSNDEYESIMLDKDIINSNIPLINTKSKNGIEQPSYAYFSELRETLKNSGGDEYKLSFLLDSIFSFFIKKHNESVKQSEYYDDLVKKVFDSMNIVFPEQKNEAHQNNSKKKAGFVYIASCGIENTYKIGKANDITKREKAFITGNHLLKIFAYTESQNPLKLESLLHSVYAQKNISGEWFELSKEELEDLIKSFCFSIAIEEGGK